jgi:hypothetical protein
MGKEIIQGITRRTLVRPRRSLIMVVAAFVLLTAVCGEAFSAQDSQDASDNTESTPLTPEALQQLVAPIALYPDGLVAQILAASTYPTEIVEAERWLQDHTELTDDKLAKEVDKESWDPSIKALTTFPTVLANLDTNLSWTSALGDAYFNQQQDVLDAVQILRTKAEAAGALQSTSQQTVTSEGTTIVIEPADPSVCYLPSYDPWLVYGAPIGIYPGYIYSPWIGPPYVSFGLGIGIGGRFWGGFGWGFHNWGFNWRNHNVIFNHNTYFSNSRTFFHRFPGRDGGNFNRGQGQPRFPGGNGRGGFGGQRGRDSNNRGFDRGANQNPNFNLGHDGHDGRGTFPNQNGHDFRGFGQPGPNTGVRSGAFDGFGQGGVERGSASRGRDSFGGFGGGHGPGSAGRGGDGRFGGGGGFGGGGNRGGGGGRGGARGGGRH